MVHLVVVFVIFRRTLHLFDQWRRPPPFHRLGTVTGVVVQSGGGGNSRPCVLGSPTLFPEEVRVGSVPSPRLADASDLLPSSGLLMQGSIGAFEGRFHLLPITLGTG